MPVARLRPRRLSRRTRQARTNAQSGTALDQPSISPARARFPRERVRRTVNSSTVLPNRSRIASMILAGLSETSRSCRIVTIQPAARPWGRRRGRARLLTLSLRARKSLHETLTKWPPNWPQQKFDQLIEDSFEVCSRPVSCIAPDSRLPSGPSAFWEVPTRATCRTSPRRRSRRSARRGRPWTGSASRRPI